MAQSYNSVIFSIAQNCENPEKAMEVLDYIYESPEVMNLINWGEEGVDYVLEDAGINEVIAAKQEQFDKWLSENQ